MNKPKGGQRAQYPGYPGWSTVFQYLHPPSAAGFFLLLICGIR